MKVKLKNFQAFRSAEFEFDPGFTLITGPTDNGKTVVFRALTTLLTNSVDAPAYINGDALKEKEDAELVVTISDTDIPKIEFHRNKAKAWYVINGKKYSKLARSNIFDIYPDLHKKFIYCENDPRKLLNFQTEKQLAFPFDRSDSEMFKLFERIFNISDTRAIMDTIKKEEDEINFKLNQNQIDKNTLTQEYEILSTLVNGINRDMIHHYADKYHGTVMANNACYYHLTTIASYSPFLVAVKDLPVLATVDDTLYDQVCDLARKLGECATKQKYVNNFTEVALSKLDDNLEEDLIQLKDKIAQITYLENAIAIQEKFLTEEEKKYAQYTQELNEFDVCPLCGHSLKEKS